VTSEDGAERFQFGSQLPKIVDFPVKNEHKPAGPAVHGLAPLIGQIDNRQTTVSKCNSGIGVDPGSACIRPAVTDRIVHPNDGSL